MFELLLIIVWRAVYSRKFNCNVLFFAGQTGSTGSPCKYLTRCVSNFSIDRVQKNCTKLSLSEYASHEFILFAIFAPKLTKVGVEIWRSSAKAILRHFCRTRCIVTSTFALVYYAGGAS